MPTSKKRGGKKAHNKRATKRNKNIANTQRAYEKLYTTALPAHLEKLNPEQNAPSGPEETSEN